MRISDWSSDVCSSDLIAGELDVEPIGRQSLDAGGEPGGRTLAEILPDPEQRAPERVLAVPPQRLDAALRIETLVAGVLEPLAAQPELVIVLTLGDEHGPAHALTLVAAGELELIHKYLGDRALVGRSEEHTSELQSLMHTS